MQLAIYIYKTNERSKEMNGLSSSEVLRSREMHGSNKLPEPKMKKWYDFAKEALSEKITMILIAIAVLQLFLFLMSVTLSGKASSSKCVLLMQPVPKAFPIVAAVTAFALMCAALTGIIIGSVRDATA